MHSFYLAHVKKTMQYWKYCDGILAISAVSCGESGTTNWILFPYTSCWQSMGECKSSCCFGWRFMDIYGFYGHFHLSWKQLNSPWSSTMYICPLWSNTCRTWLPEKTPKKSLSGKHWEGCPRTFWIDIFGEKHVSWQWDVIINAAGCFFGEILRGSIKLHSLEFANAHPLKTMILLELCL